MQTKRHYNKWTVNEVLSLQREYELLEMTISQIATKHQRTPYSILYKLEQEGFITNWNDARGFTEINSDNLSEMSFDLNSNQNLETKSQVDKLADRVWSLETDVKQIGTMVKQMFDNLVVANKPLVSKTRQSSRRL